MRWHPQSVCGDRVEGQGRPRDAGEGTQENNTLSGLGGPEHRARTGARAAARLRTPRKVPSPTVSFPKWEGYRRWGPARRGRGPEAPRGPRPRLPPSQPGGGGGSAPRPREAILAAGPPKAREALRLTVSRSRPHRGRCPPRAGRGRGARPAAGRRSEGGGHGGAAGVWASCRRDPGGGASRGRGGRGRGAVTYTGPQPPPPPPRCGWIQSSCRSPFWHLPPAGWALRRARRVGSHGGRRGAEEQRRRGREGERERGSVRSRPRRAGPRPRRLPLPPRTPSLTRTPGWRPPPPPQSLPQPPAPPRRPGPGKGPRGDPDGAHYTHHRWKKLQGIWESWARAAAAELWTLTRCLPPLPRSSSAENRPPPPAALRRRPRARHPGSCSPAAFAAPTGACRASAEAGLGRPPGKAGLVSSAVVAKARRAAPAGRGSRGEWPERVTSTSLFFLLFTSFTFACPFVLSLLPFSIVHFSPGLELD